MASPTEANELREREKSSPALGALCRIYLFPHADGIPGHGRQDLTAHRSFWENLAHSVTERSVAHGSRWKLHA